MGIECWWHNQQDFQNDPLLLDSDYIWLLELAANKMDYTPNLRNIHLEDEDSIDHEAGEVGSLVPWEPPYKVADAMAGAGIHITGEVVPGY